MTLDMTQPYIRGGVGLDRRKISGMGEIPDFKSILSIPGSALFSTDIWNWINRFERYSVKKWKSLYSPYDGDSEGDDNDDIDEDRDDDSDEDDEDDTPCDDDSDDRDEERGDDIRWSWLQTRFPGRLWFATTRLQAMFS